MPDITLSFPEQPSAQGPAVAHDFTERLETISGESSATHAIILVGGIHDNFKYFDAWVPAMSSADNLVLGFDHDHQAMTMQEAALTLAEAVRALKDQGITDVTIVAHSMGGLVSKGAIDELSRTGDAEKFDSIDLHALGAPWGGFAMADLARYLPGSEAISQAIGYPMGPEMGPGSEYLKNLSQPMPSNGELHLYRGDIDTVSTPEADNTKARYASTESNATSVTILAGFEHNDYNTAPPELLGSSRGETVPGFETQGGMAVASAAQATAGAQDRQRDPETTIADASAGMGM